MPNVRDDPRQVLALLNSLGFVGITAEQLKAFMKDLKMCRKIKEREREEWKDEMKKNILRKQQDEFRRILTGTPSPEVSDDPVVKIKIRCVSESDTNEEIENQVPNIIPSKKIQKKEENFFINPEKTANRSRNQCKSTKTVTSSIKATTQSPPRAASVPNLLEQAPKVSRPKSACSEPIRQKESPRNPSRCSSRSQSKSFIRPWKLYPDVHRVPHTLKSDPVTLYQNYQKGWKQISFPGENRHANIRWAVREKMLGTDPTPRPVIKKSCSSMSVKRR